MRERRKGSQCSNMLYVLYLYRHGFCLSENNTYWSIVFGLPIVAIVDIHIILVKFWTLNLGKLLCGL